MKRIEVIKNLEDKQFAEFLAKIEAISDNKDRIEYYLKWIQEEVEE